MAKGSNLLWHPFAYDNMGLSYNNNYLNYIHGHNIMWVTSNNFHVNYPCLYNEPFLSFHHGFHQSTWFLVPFTLPLANDGGVVVLEDC